MQNSNTVFGFINIYKPRGLTSHDVVSRLRRITKIRQIGHTGTLDPFAEGVLPICIGKATRLIEYLNDDKEYIATVQLGKDTDSYDIEGNVIKIYDKKVTKAEFEDVLNTFEGEIEQIPPIYSAIKVGGKKLYEYARQGLDVEIKPRKVYISNIELIDFDETNQCAKFKVGCSKGTYIRSIAYDIGQKLNCGGHLINLIRTKAGRFRVENSVRLEDLSEVSDVIENLINPLDILDLPKYVLNEDEREKVSHGMSLINSEGFRNSDIVILIYSGRIYAIGMVNTSKIMVKKVFEVL